MDAKARQYFYLISGVLAAAIPLLVQLGVLDTGNGENVNTLVASLGGLLGAGGAVTAAHHVRVQRAAGMHDPALDPIDQVTESAKAILEQQQTANAAADKLRQVTGDLLTGVTSSIPVVGPAVAVGNNLVQDALDQILPH